MLVSGGMALAINSKGMFSAPTYTSTVSALAFFFFQAEDGIRDLTVTGVQTCALPISGLFMLRESTAALPVWCTDNVNADLTRGNPVFEVLAHYCGVERRAMIPDGSPFAVDGVSGVQWRALAPAGRAAPHSPHPGAPGGGGNVALGIGGGGARAAAGGRPRPAAP